ncbi:CZB domain-containing protein [Sulfuricurvum sp. MLSB]|uniref:CZB domain-containing protein n=2 Tax=unclassified Sulfuricurvum TaxID=2632390 RepID=UPI0025CEC4CE|nr:CZB domain-containing protein [Sulfuricurvum sp. MLSB]
MFKSNAYKAITNGKAEMQFSDHHSCRLGKWYDGGMGHERFAHLSSFKPMEKPHETVHVMVHNNLVFIEGEDHSIEHQEEVLNNFKTMEEASYTLFGLMDNLIKESEEDLMKRANQG